MERLARLTLPPPVGELVEVLFDVAIAARDEGSVIDARPLGGSERPGARHYHEEAACDRKAHRAQLRPVFLGELPLLHVAEQAAQQELPPPASIVPSPPSR